MRGSLIAFFDDVASHKSPLRKRLILASFSLSNDFEKQESF